MPEQSNLYNNLHLFSEDISKDNKKCFFVCDYKDLFNLCVSYLSEEERNYSEEKWNKFKKKDVCNIAAVNGWIDLLQWAIKNGCDWDSWTCTYAAENGQLEILKIGGRATKKWL